MSTGLDLSVATANIQAAPIKAPTQTANEMAAKKAAKEFESVFISEFMGQMFEGISTDGEFGGGEGEAMFRPLLLDEYSKQLTAQGGFGLSQAVTRQLLQAQEGPNVRVNPRIERVLALTERLTEALKADIKALEQGRPRDMRTIEPETQQLAALYGREANAINAATLKTLPAPVRAKLTEATARFQDALKLQQRLITRMKNASEGIVRAIATDVERKRNATRPYGRTPTQAPRPASALLYNSVA